VSEQELFDDLPETKSPRLSWMERHGVNCKRNDNTGLFEAWTGDYEKALCYTSSEVLGDFGIHESADKDEALRKLAVAQDITLWNEEGAL
jgi:hypothetical protein